MGPRGKKVGLKEVVTITGRGNKIKGSAATVGLSTYLTRGKGGILTVSVSPRKGAADNFNISGGNVRGALCRLLLKRTRAGSAVMGSIIRGLSLVPSGVGLSNTRVRLMKVSSGRFVLGKVASGLQHGCSCVVLSYPPSLGVLAVGTLATTASMLIPVRYRCCTLRKLSRLVRAVSLMGRELGGHLGVRNMMFAVCSTEAGLSLRMIRGMGRGLGRGVCGAVVPHGMELTRTPDCKRPVGVCSPESTKTRDCELLTRRILGERSGW